LRKAQSARGKKGGEETLSVGKKVRHGKKKKKWRSKKAKQKKKKGEAARHIDTAKLALKEASQKKKRGKSLYLQGKQNLSQA